MFSTMKKHKIENGNGECVKETTTRPYNTGAEDHTHFVKRPEALRLETSSRQECLRNGNLSTHRNTTSIAAVLKSKLIEDVL